MKAPKRRRLVGGNNALLTGFVATFENADGKRLVVHRKGRRLPLMLRELCDEVVWLDPTFRLRCYSTPDTIYSDLLGRDPGTLPEAYALSIAGRPEMIFR